VKAFIAALIIGILILLQPGQSPVLYVAPYGTAIAAGDSDSPRTLASVLCSGCVPAGSTVFLLPGRYVGPFVSNVSGSATSPITIRSVPGTRARLDGKLDINGEWTTWRDLELTYTGWTTRTSAYAGSPVLDIPNTDLYIIGPGTRIERSVIHDISDVGWWQPSINSAFVDTLIYSIGWWGPDRGHGHGLYTQNHPGGGKLIQNVISSGNYSTCGKIYGVIANLKDYTVDGLTCAPSLDARFLVGGEQGTADNILIKNSLFFGTQLSVGNRHPNPLTPTGAITMTDNVIAYPTGLPFVSTYWKQVNFTNNLVVGGNASDPANRFLIKTVSMRPAWQFAGNTYHSIAPWTLFANAEGQAYYTFPQWQAAGRDAGSSITSTLPVTNTINIRATSPHHGTVTVLNWLGSASVALDLSSMALTPGASYKLVNAQNPGESLPFVASSTPVSLPTAPWTVATPIGATQPLVAFDSKFLVFLVEPQ
jgi:hypothetical protein